MPGISFDSHAEALLASGNIVAAAAEPQFDVAYYRLDEARCIVAAEDDRLQTVLFSARIDTARGVVSARQGLYHRQRNDFNDEQATEYVLAGKNQIYSAYGRLKDTLEQDVELYERDWQASTHSYLCETMAAWFRTTQTAQLLRGQLGPDKKATERVIKLQWMLGRGILPTTLGAWAHGQKGDDPLATVETTLLGVRGERINGGPVHFAKGLKWLLRSLPPIAEARRQPQRREVMHTAGRLLLDSATRQRAMAAALDHQRF